MQNDVWDVVPRKGEICGGFEMDLQDKTCS
jgi:hypothetical protein